MTKKTLRSGLAVLTAAMLASCATVPDQQGLTAETMLLTPYINKAAQPFDVDEFFAAMPGWLEASYANATYDGASGAMVIDGLLVGIRDKPELRISIDQARIWDGDANAVSLAFNGGAMAEKLFWFDRASFQGIRGEGLSIDGMLGSADLSIDKAVFDGLSVQSFDLAPVEGEPPFAPALRTLAALAGSYALEGEAYSNINLRMAEPGGAQIIGTIARSFSRGYDSGRQDYTRTEGLSFSSRAGSNAAVYEVSASPFDPAAAKTQQDVTPEAKEQAKILQPWMRETVEKAGSNPIAFLAANQSAGESSVQIDVIEQENVDLANAFRWLAAWELPPVTETDLMDLGTLSLSGYRQYMNNTLVTSTERTEISAFDFYWLIPSAYSQADEGITVNTAELLEIVIAEEQLSGAEIDEIKQMRDAVTALGLDRIEANTQSNWFWDGDTGALSTFGNADLIDLAAFDLALDMDGPSLLRWQELTANNTDGFGNLAAELFLNMFTFKLTDQQLLNNAFAYGASQSGTTVEDLQTTVPGLLKLGTAQIAPLNPRIPVYVDALSQFLAEGGSIEIKSTPAAAVSFADIEVAGETDPASILDLLDVTVERTPGIQ